MVALIYKCRLCGKSFETEVGELTRFQSHQAIAELELKPFGKEQLIALFTFHECSGDVWSNSGDFQCGLADFQGVQEKAQSADLNVKAEFLDEEYARREQLERDREDTQLDAGEVCPDCAGQNIDLIGDSGGGCPSCVNGRIFR